MYKKQEQFIKSLHSGHSRKTTGHCLVEGIRALTTFSTSRHTLVDLYVTTPAARQWAKELATITSYTTITPQIISDETLERISASKTPSGVLGIFKLATIQEPLQWGIVCAALSDPGNVGTLIRTAAAMNKKTVIMVEGVDPWNPKVIQASAGALALVDVFQLSWEELLQRKGPLPLNALVPRGGTALEKQHGKGLLVIGNEAHGIPASWLNQCDELVTLPMPGNTESLNAAIAGSIALYLTTE